MDSVPFDFSERVSARWQCCPFFQFCYCTTTFKATEKWSFSEKIHVTLVFGFVGGKVKYGFSNPDYIRNRYILPGFETLPLSQYFLTMEGLKKRRDFKHIQIDVIDLENTWMSKDFREIAITFLDVELRMLLKFVSYLSNNPELKIRTHRDLPRTPEGIIIKNWVEEWSFSRVRIASFTSTDQRLLECRFQKANPVYGIVKDVSGEEDKHFLQESLKSGQLRIFSSDIEFPFEVLEGMIANYQKSPEDYTPDKYEMWLKFDKTTVDSKLAEMVEKGLCEVEDDIYRFHSNTAGTAFCVQ